MYCEYQPNSHTEISLQYTNCHCRGCKGFQCGTQCKFTRAIRWMTPAEVGSNSHCPDNMEAACSLLGTYMTTLNCSMVSISSIFFEQLFHTTVLCATILYLQLVFVYFLGMATGKKSCM